MILFSQFFTVTGHRQRSSLFWRYVTVVYVFSWWHLVVGDFLNVLTYHLSRHRREPLRQCVNVVVVNISFADIGRMNEQDNSRVC